MCGPNVIAKCYSICKPYIDMAIYLYLYICEYNICMCVYIYNIYVYYVYITHPNALLSDVFKDTQCVNQVKAEWSLLNWRCCPEPRLCFLRMESLWAMVCCVFKNQDIGGLSWLLDLQAMFKHILILLIFKTKFFYSFIFWLCILQMVCDRISQY